MGMNAPTAAIARPKGPIVWLDRDQQQLDDAYDQLVYAPNRDQLAKRRVANSAAARAWLGEPLRFAYGPMPIEALMSIDRSRIVLPPSVQEHPSPSSCTGKPGAPAPHPSSRSWPSRSCVPAPVSRCSISSMSTMPAATYFRWSSKCAAPSAGCIATPKVSAATATALSDFAFRPDRILPAAW